MQTQQRAANAINIFSVLTSGAVLAERNLVVCCVRLVISWGSICEGAENHEAFKTHFGSDHEYTLAARMGLANALRAAGRLERRGCWVGGVGRVSR